MATEPIDQSVDNHELALDDESLRRLSLQGYSCSVLDADDAEAFARWMQADARGFYDVRPDEEQVEFARAAFGDRRLIGVYDPEGFRADSPVATVGSWLTELSLPGGQTLPTWAISSVTVAPTHRRKGIARALLEGELRTASSAGVALAALTVSESTIYGRYGFAPAAFATDLTIEPRRARWTGPVAPGRVEFITLEDARAALPALHDQARTLVAGQIPLWPGYWTFHTGGAPATKDEAKKLRAAQYRNADGEVEGIALYTATENLADYTKNSVVLDYLSTSTGEAYAAIWRFLLELDLVERVTAPLRRIDEPVRWQVADWRAVQAKPSDHLWLRILDVPAALEGRRYATSGRLTLDIRDELGFADGAWLLEVDGAGEGKVTRLTAEPSADGRPGLSLGVNELAALYLGGTTAAELAEAGRISETTPGSISVANAILGTPTRPWLDVWF